MIGWLVALVYNAVADLAGALAGDFEGCHIRTLRRMFFNRPGTLAGDWGGCHVRTLRRTFWDRPGTLYQTPEALVVQLDRFGGQEVARWPDGYKAVALTTPEASSPFGRVWLPRHGDVIRAERGQQCHLPVG